MKQMLYKELTLTIPKGIWLFALMPAMLLIPSYPYLVAMGYVFLAVFTACNAASINRDHEFTASLPVKRSDIVLSRMLGMIVLEGLTLLAAIPFALLGTFLVNPDGNTVGMDANLAFFGFTMTEYAVFNLIFFPLYFRTAYKAGIPALLGTIGYAVAGTLIELLVQFVPGLRVLDASEIGTAGYRAIVLCMGIAAFAAGTFAAYRVSVKNFERVNL